MCAVKVENFLSNYVIIEITLYILNSLLSRKNINQKSIKNFCFHLYQSNIQKKNIKKAQNNKIANVADSV